jgi:hypothetical protein
VHISSPRLLSGKGYLIYFLWNNAILKHLGTEGYVPALLHPVALPSLDSSSTNKWGLSLFTIYIIA